MPEEVTATAPPCPQCLHGWHGRRVCRDANCCSCRLTWRDAWKAGYMQGWRDYPTALWRGFYPPTEVEMESNTTTDLPPFDAVVEVAFRGRVAAYNDDYNGTVSVEVLADDGRPLGYYANVPREAVWIADEHAPDVPTKAPRSYVTEWLMGNESLVAKCTHLLLDAVEEATTRHTDVHPHRVTDCEMCQFRGRVATAVLLNEPWAASDGT